MTDPRIERTYWALRLTYGLVPFLAGLDKFTNLLTNWPKYVSPALARLLPISPQAAMIPVGLVEMAVGLAILLRFPRLGGYVAAAWLALIAANLVAGGMFDIAVRDVALAVGAVALATLHQVRVAAEQARAVPTAGEAPVSSVRRAA